MIASLLFHECPLIVIVTLGRLPWPSDSTTSGGTSNPLIGSGRSTVVRNFMSSAPRRPPPPRPNSPPPLCPRAPDICPELHDPPPPPVQPISRLTTSSSSRAS